MSVFDGEIKRNDRDYDYWYGFSDYSLKKLCQAFNLPISGTKKEKAARLCFAWELGYEPKGTDDVAQIVEAEMRAKLNLGLFSIHDPKSISPELWKPGPPSNQAIFERKQIIDYYMKNPFIAPSDVADLNK
jgi:hypothetical protein